MGRFYSCLEVYLEVYLEEDEYRDDARYDSMTKMSCVGWINLDKSQVEYAYCTISLHCLRVLLLEIQA